MGCFGVWRSWFIHFSIVFNGVFCFGIKFNWIKKLILYSNKNEIIWEGLSQKLSMYMIASSPQNMYNKKQTIQTRDFKRTKRTIIHQTQHEGKGRVHPLKSQVVSEQTQTSKTYETQLKLWATLTEKFGIVIVQLTNRKC